MAQTGFVAQHRPKMFVALILTFASGLVDIVGYLGVFHFFTAHLTGTTVQLGHNLVARHWRDVIAAASIVAAFLAGSILGRVLIEIGSRRRFRKIASITLAIEAILLLAASKSPGDLGAAPYGALTLLAGAMGMQTATLTRIGPLTVHTTFVTGMLNKIAQLISHIMFRSYDLLRSKSRGQGMELDQKRDIQAAVFLLMIWLFYVTGAAAGTWTFGLWRMHALFCAVALLVTGIFTDQLSPLSIREEKEQSEW